MGIMEQAFRDEKSKELLRVEAAQSIYQDVLNFFDSVSASRPELIVQPDGELAILHLWGTNSHPVEIILNRPREQVDFVYFVRTDPQNPSEYRYREKIFTVSSFHGQARQFFDTTDHKGMLLGYKRTLALRHELTDKLFHERNLPDAPLIRDGNKLFVPAPRN